MLLHHIKEFQVEHTLPPGSFKSSIRWLNLVERNSEERGLLRRNPERSAVAIKKVKRDFFKAQHPLWREFGFIRLGRSATNERQHISRQGLHYRPGSDHRPPEEVKAWRTREEWAAALPAGNLRGAKLASSTATLI